MGRRAPHGRGYKFGISILHADQSFQLFFRELFGLETIRAPWIRHVAIAWCIVKIIRMLAKNNWKVCIQFTCPCNWFRLLTNIHVSKASSIAKISQPDHEICSHDFWKSIIFLVRRIIMPNWDDCIIWFRCVHYIAGRPQSITTWRRFFSSWKRNSKFYFSIIKWTKSINENDV